MNRKLFVFHVIIPSLKCFESSVWFPQYCVLKKYDNCYFWGICSYGTWIPSEANTPRLFTEIIK